MNNILSTVYMGQARRINNWIIKQENELEPPFYKKVISKWQQIRIILEVLEREDSKLIFFQ